MSQPPADPASLPPLPKDHLSHPDQWATGSDPATSKQKGFIKVLEKQHPDAAPEGGIEVEGMQKGEASEVIEKLKNGETVEATNGQAEKEEKVDGLMGEIQGITNEEESKGDEAQANEQEVEQKAAEPSAKPSSQTNGHPTSSQSKGKRITSESNGKPSGDPTASFSDLLSAHETKKTEAAAQPPSSSQVPPSSQVSEQVDFSGVDKNPTKQTTLDAHVANETKSSEGQNGSTKEDMANGQGENDVTENLENGHAAEVGDATVEETKDKDSKSARKRKEEEVVAEKEEGGVSKKAKVDGTKSKEAIDEIVADEEW